MFQNSINFAQFFLLKSAFHIIFRNVQFELFQNIVQDKWTLRNLYNFS